MNSIHTSCPHLASVPTTSCVSNVCNHSHFCSAHVCDKTALGRISRDPGPPVQVPMPLPNHNSIESKNALFSLKTTLAPTLEQAAAVPLGAPSIMPSPHYYELDGETDLATTALKLQPRCTRELHVSTDISETANVCLQEEVSEESVCLKTSQHSDEQQLENSTTEV